MDDGKNALFRVEFRMIDPEQRHGGRIELFRSGPEIGNEVEPRLFVFSAVHGIASGHSDRQRRDEDPVDDLVRRVQQFHVGIQDPLTVPETRFPQFLFHILRHVRQVRLQQLHQFRLPVRFRAHGLYAVVPSADRAHQVETGVFDFVRGCVVETEIPLRIGPRCAQNVMIIDREDLLPVDPDGPVVTVPGVSLVAVGQAESLFPHCRIVARKIDAQKRKMHIVADRLKEAEKKEKRYQYGLFHGGADRFVFHVTSSVGL